MKKIAYMTPQTRAVMMDSCPVMRGGSPIEGYDPAPRRIQTIRHVPSLSTIPTPKI